MLDHILVPSDSKLIESFITKVQEDRSYQIALIATDSKKSHSSIKKAIFTILNPSNAFIDDSKHFESYIKVF